MNMTNTQKERKQKKLNFKKSKKELRNEFRRKECKGGI